jgi:RimJ/RimL family protein N-acetyltransferase
MPEKIKLNDYGQPVGCIVETDEFMFPQKITLEGEYCKLEPLQANTHAEMLFNELCQNNTNDVWTYLAYGPFSIFDEFSSWMDSVSSLKNQLFFAVINKINNTVSGITSLINIVQQHGTIEIAHVHFSPNIKKTRVATEAIYLMLSYVFDRLKYRRCEWKCDVLNEGSKSAAIRFGFVPEGVFENHFIVKNRSRDTAWYAITDKNWISLKESFISWLLPENFTSDGGQIKRLSEFRTTEEGGYES